MVVTQGLPSVCLRTALWPKVNGERKGNRGLILVLVNFIISRIVPRLVGDDRRDEAGLRPRQADRRGCRPSCADKWSEFNERALDFYVSIISRHAH